jgi:ribosomal protein S18 acetylase RimI-like enzyme
MDPLLCLKVNFAAHITRPLMIPAGDGGSVYLEEALAVGDSGTDCDTFNMIAGASFSPEVPTERIREVIAQAIGTFEGRPFSWWVTTGDLPADLGEHLMAAGLVAAETEVAMALPLLAHETEPIALRVARVTTPEQLIEYATVQAENWNPRDERVIDFYRKRAEFLLAPDSGFLFVLGYTKDGQAVAAGEGCLTDAVTWGPTVHTLGLYGISTRAAWRGRGYGRAICRTLLNTGVAKGAQLAVLQASADGLRLYEQLGFAPIGAVTEYKPK